MEVMKAAVFTNVGKIEIKEIEKPVPQKGEVLVRIKACALCTWEQRIFKGVSRVPFPYIGGHEISGVIEEIGENVDEQRWKVGQKVAIRILRSCGECHYCRTGANNLCEMIGKEGEELRLPYPGLGGLSEYLVVPPTKLFKLANDIPFEIGALSEPLACVIHSVERANIELGDDVVIIGAGVMGLLHVMIAKIRGARVIVSEINAERQKLAKQLGADEIINPLEKDPVEEVKKLTEGRGADVVINTTPVSKVAETTVQIAGKRGRVIFYSSQHPDYPIQISPDWIHRSEIVITGSVSPDITDFYRATKLLSSKIVNPQLLISEIVPFEKIEEAFRKATDPQNYRIVVQL